MEFLAKYELERSHSGWQRSSVLSLTKDSRFRQAVRVWDHDQDRSMHVAVTWGSGDAGRGGERADHAAETRLAGQDCAAVGGACLGDEDHPRGWQEQGHAQVGQ